MRNERITFERVSVSQDWSRIAQDATSEPNLQAKLSGVALAQAQDMAEIEAQKSTETARHNFRIWPRS